VPMAQPDNEHNRHEHHGECGNEVSLRDRGQYRPLGIEQVIEGNDSQVEQIAANQVGHGQVFGPNSHGGKGNGYLGQGSGEGKEKATHKALSPSVNLGKFITDKGEPETSAYDEDG